MLSRFDPPPPEILGQPLRTDDAAEYASLQEILRDLHHVNRCFHEYRQTGQDQTTLRTALWESAVISYRRTFEDGAPMLPGQKRTKLRFDQVPADHRMSHDHMMLMANRQVAHQVSGLSQPTVCLVVDEDAAEEIGPIFYRLWKKLSPPDEEIPRFNELILALKEVVDSRIVELSDAMLQPTDDPDPG